MTYAIAKLMLENAHTFLDRKEAVKTAMSLGMPLSDIEEYLDWVDMARGGMARGEMARAEDGAGREESQRPKAG